MNRFIAVVVDGAYTGGAMRPTVPSCSRRGFLRGSLSLAGLGLLSGCGILPPQAQQLPAKPPTVGALATGSPTGPNAAFIEAFRQGLRDLGHVEGQTIVIEYRWWEREDQLPDFAGELVRLNVAVIFAPSTPAAHAAKQATGAIPIVTAVAGDPVRTGLVESLARPGGNVTGLTNISQDLAGKRLQLLRDAVGGITRVAFLTNPTNPSHSPTLAEMEAAAGTLAVRLQPLEVRGRGDLEAAFEAAAAGGAEGLMALGDPLLNSERARVVDLAARNRLPAMYDPREFVEVGGLMAYGPSRPDLYRRAAGYVDRILKGARPSDLPVQQPTTFDFVINLRTAQALGLAIPSSVLQQATELIQ